MFAKILIANRGEIACRVIKTARRLGIRTVAVFSDADAGARHVRLADEAVHIGPPEAKASYLDGARIIAAALQSGAQAIHPGYGFLSENADFAEAVAAAGLVFIGPPPAAIRAMGDKSAAKALMAQAGVPLTPGYHGDNQDSAFLHQQADAIGYPVLIKASAGGGGKGMRRVEASADFLDALAACRREASNAFGSEHVLIERYVTRPRHIEIQVFADTQGNAVYLFERDCSVQRRHQKVLEEAPAPGMTPERRRQMGEAAVAAAKAVGYVGAGTVEFIAQQDGSFFFMEMNTRLQVEHPVTEMISGQDLVEWQLRVAAGESLPVAQEALEIRGHALEARIYAEDPERGFLPATGKLLALQAPAESLHVRVDSGVETGDSITPWYDPMIAKLIVWDRDRDAALARMRQALADFRVAGLTTNIAFLSRLLSCPAFAQADLDTGLIENHHAQLLPERQPASRTVLLAAALGELLWEAHRAHRAVQSSTDPYSPWAAGDGWQLNLRTSRTLHFRDGERRIEIVARPLAQGWQLTLEGHDTLASAEHLKGDRFAIALDDRRLEAHLLAHGMERHIFIASESRVLLRDDPLHVVSASEATGGQLTAPMPGKIVAHLVAPGTTVAAGTPLLILEAMKMEHTITAPHAGTLTSFAYAPGESVDEGETLLKLGALPPSFISSSR